MYAQTKYRDSAHLRDYVLVELYRTMGQNIIPVYCTKCVDNNPVVLLEHYGLVIQCSGIIKN